MIKKYIDCVWFLVKIIKTDVTCFYRRLRTACFSALGNLGVALSRGRYSKMTITVPEQYHVPLHLFHQGKIRTLMIFSARIRRKKAWFSDAGRRTQSR